jgi:hypothetical protein
MLRLHRGSARNQMCVSILIFWACTHWEFKFTCSRAAKYRALSLFLHWSVSCGFWALVHVSRFANIGYVKLYCSHVWHVPALCSRTWLRILETAACHLEPANSPCVCSLENDVYAKHFVCSVHTVAKHYVTILTCMSFLLVGRLGPRKLSQTLSTTWPR